MKKTILASISLLSFAAHAHAASIDVDFNTVGALASNFNGVTPESSLSWTEETTGGISNSGSVTLPVDDGLAEIWISKSGFNVAPNSTYTVGAYFYNVNNGGYAALGFTTSSTSNYSTVFGAPSVENSAGVDVHSGGNFLHSTTTSTSGSWASGDILTLNNWYYLTVTLTLDDSDNYTEIVSVYDSDSNGVQGSLLGTSTLSGTDTTLGTASILYPYIGSEGRFSTMDGFSSSSSSSVVPEPSTISLAGALGVITLLRRRRI